MASSPLARSRTTTTLPMSSSRLYLLSVRDAAPPIRTLGLLPARTVITLLIKYSYNTRMHHLRNSIPERIVATSIFSRFEVLFNTGVIDCRDQLIKLRCLPSDKGGLGMPSLEGHHGRCHQLITAMRSSTVRGPILRELQFKSCSFSAKLHFRIRECLKYQVY